MYEKISKEKCVVQKYGGTSVGDISRITMVARRIHKFHSQGWKKLAIVVSAMSGETNRLVALMKEVHPSGRPSTKSYDMTVSAGEQVSVGLMAAALEAQGVSSEPFLGYQVGIFTDESHGQAKIQSIRTEAIENAWQRGAIPIIAGFQGVTENLEITTLGRGGSDLSAVALAAALKASFCEINTDVEGVYTADPRYVPKAKLLEELDYETALELAASGGKVLHSRCVEVGAKYQVPIVVRSSFLPDEGRKTVIMSFNAENALEAPVVSAISLDQNVSKITVKGVPAGGVTLSSVFSKVAEKGVNVDIIVHDRQNNDDKDRFGFTVQKEDVSIAISAIESLRNQRGFEQLSTEVQNDLAKVSAVGLGMRSHSGVANRAFGSLTQSGIDILMISTSEIKISCVVHKTNGQRAAQVLHDTFFSN